MFLAAITSSGLGISAGLWLLIQQSHKAMLQWQSSGDWKWRKKVMFISTDFQGPTSEMGAAGNQTALQNLHSKYKSCN